MWLGYKVTLSAYCIALHTCIKVFLEAISPGNCERRHHLLIFLGLGLERFQTPVGHLLHELLSLCQDVCRRLLQILLTVRAGILVEKGKEMIDHVNCPRRGAREEAAKLRVLGEHLVVHVHLVRVGGEGRPQFQHDPPSPPGLQRLHVPRVAMDRKREHVHLPELRSELPINVKCF